MITPPQEPNDMEDPQAGEILPPMLYDAYWQGDDTSGSDGLLDDIGFKGGMEFCYRLLLPYLKAALPHYEAGLRDTRLVQADAGKLAELASFKELVSYKQEIVNYENYDKKTS